jgi:hypothetical protein
MKIFFSLATLIFVLLAVPAPAIDFTPHFSESIEDGVPMRRMYFSDGAQRIYYRPPTNWARYGDEMAATFKPKDSPQAEVKITNASPEHARIPFDEGGLVALRQIAGTVLPPDATDVSEIWEAVNPVVLQGWTSFEVGFEYLQLGRPFCCSILFINLNPNEQVQFIVSAGPAEFRPLYQTAYRTLASWYQPTAGATQ